MKKKCKDFMSIMIILLLLPYIITLFMNGKEITASATVAKKSVKVLINEKKKQTVIEVPWNDYLTGILAKETTGRFEKEVLKAQVILIRTRLYKDLQTYKNQGKSANDYVFRESYLSAEAIEQQWREHAKEEETINQYMNKLKRAVDRTNNLILTYEGNVINAPFHQLSNGSTRMGSEVLGNGETPYLVAKECAVDKEANNQMSMVVFPYEKVGAGIVYEDIEILAKDSLGYAMSIKVGEQTYSGEEFRKDFELPSSCIAFQDYHGKLRIITQGIGHGLGLSQNMANSMEQAGQTSEEILSYFFTGVNIEEGGEIFTLLE